MNQNVNHKLEQNEQSLSPLNTQQNSEFRNKLDMYQNFDEKNTNFHDNKSYKFVSSSAQLSGINNSYFNPTKLNTNINK